MAGESLIGKLPSGWREMPLGEVCERGGGGVQTGPFGSQLHAADYVPVGIPSIMPQNIGDNRVIEEGIARITKDDAERLTRYRVRTGDIVYSRRGDVERRALIREKEDGWLCGTGCLRVRFGEGDVDPLFAFYYLGHPNVREWIVRHAHGATMPNLNTSILSALPFLVPPPHEQRAIAHILGTLDDKIELNRRMNETLETIARAIFKSWFVDFDPVRAKANGEPPESICRRLGLTPELLALFPDRLVHSELGEIPEGWDISNVSEVTEGIFSGGTPDTRKPEYWNGELRWFSSGETRNRFITSTEKKITQAGVDNSSTRMATPGDILIASAGQGNTRGQTSYCAIGTYINQSVVSVRAKSCAGHPLWLFYNLAGRYEEMRSISDSHSSRGSLTTKLIGGLPIVYPGKELLAAFGVLAEPLTSRQVENQREAKTISEVRDALLPKLISGELSLNVLEDSDEVVVA